MPCKSANVLVPCFTDNVHLLQTMRLCLTICPTTVDKHLDASSGKVFWNEALIEATGWLTTHSSDEVDEVGYVYIVNGQFAMHPLEVPEGGVLDRECMSGPRHNVGGSCLSGPRHHDGSRQSLLMLKVSVISQSPGHDGLQQSSVQTITIFQVFMTVAHYVARSVQRVPYPGWLNSLEIVYLVIY